MTRTLKYFVAAFIGLVSGIAMGQSLDPAQLLMPSKDSWPTYSGDYSGRRYSSLTQINQKTVKDLSLAFVTRLQAGPQGPAGTPPVIVAGEGTAEFNTAANIKGSILQVDGVLYIATPDNAWAIDARDGHEIWHYYWRTKGGTHIGNRGMAMWKTWVYM